MYSRHLACPVCDISYEDPAPNAFSFNSPYGACPTCNGLGEVKELDIDLMLPDESLSINQEGLAPLGKPRATWVFNQIRAVGKAYGFDFDTPLRKVSAVARNVLLHGGGDERFAVEYSYSSGRTVTYKHRFGGVLDMMKRYYADTSSNTVREWVEAYMNAQSCPECKGGRLKKENLAVRLEDGVTGAKTSIQQVVSLSIGEALQFFRSLKLGPRQAIIATPVVKEILQRLQFLVDVGLEYLTLDRPARTLSGGEGQRIRLATQIGSQLVGVLYILDEPSIGLHQRDNRRLISSLQKLRDLGNTLIVVEHDRDMIESADFVIDLGPGPARWRAPASRLVLPIPSPNDWLNMAEERVPRSRTLHHCRASHYPVPHTPRGNGSPLARKATATTRYALKTPAGQLIARARVPGKSTLTETL
jgi:excinuclease ABC subunit A